MPYLTPNAPPDQTVCRVIKIPADAAWLSIVDGALSELMKVYRFEQFGDYTPEQTAARFMEMYDQYVLDGACTDMANACCRDAVRYRFNANGELESSVNGGPWALAPDDPRITAIPEPVSPVYGDITKCDVATRFAAMAMSRFLNTIIESHGGGGDYAAIAGTIIGIIFLLLDITLVGALLTPLLLALVGEILRGVSEDQQAYATDEANEIALKCAFFCAAGDDGMLSESGYIRFLNSLSTQLPEGAGKSALIHMLMVLGRNTLNQYGALDVTSGNDCSSCECSTFCDFSEWEIHGGRGTIIEQNADHITVEAVLLGATYWVDIDAPTLESCCCGISYIRSGEPNDIFNQWYNPCTLDNSTDENLSFTYTGQSANRWGYAASTPFTLQIFSAYDCP